MGRRNRSSRPRLHDCSPEACLFSGPARALRLAETLQVLQRGCRPPSRVERWAKSQVGNSCWCRGSNTGRSIDRHGSRQLMNDMEQRQVFPVSSPHHAGALLEGCRRHPDADSDLFHRRIMRERCWGEKVSQTRIVKSPDADTRRVPSGEKTRPWT